MCSGRRQKQRPQGRCRVLRVVFVRDGVTLQPIQSIQSTSQIPAAKLRGWGPQRTEISVRWRNREVWNFQNRQQRFGELIASRPRPP
eukprot:4406902-Prymnesium_polylepis.1